MPPFTISVLCQIFPNAKYLPSTIKFPIKMYPPDYQRMPTSLRWKDQCLCVLLHFQIPLPSVSHRAPPGCLLFCNGAQVTSQGSGQCSLFVPIGFQLWREYWAPSQVEIFIYLIFSVSKQTKNPIKWCLYWCQPWRSVMVEWKCYWTWGSQLVSQARFSHLTSIG